MMAERPVLVFDSGIGGLSVLRAMRAAPTRYPIVYVADDAAFPYGAWEEPALVEHVHALFDRLIGTYDPKAVVIACNTASTLVLPRLRAFFSLPFVGTVPAIKPAAERSRSGVVAVLATPGTIAREYTRGLIREFAAHCHVRLVGSPLLAGIAEAHLRGEAVDEAEVRAQIVPCFVEVGGERTDVVVLGCTHYPFLAPLFERLAPWPVEWLDPAPAIARRLAAVLGEEDKAGRAWTGGEAVFTSGRPAPAALAAVLAREGLAVRRPMRAAV